MSNAYENWERFIDLFGGLDHTRRIGAFGTGRGQWIKRPLRPDDVVQHLQGVGPGIGVGPLNPDNKVPFAAIDLDEPDFEAAKTMQEFIPGTSFIERSRSGNAHVWVFFCEPLEAWVAMGILKEATIAAGKQHVEIFPKNYDFSRVKFGNYINLPYHGDSRPIVGDWDGVQEVMGRTHYLNFEEWGLGRFIHEALLNRLDPEEWRKRARWLLISPPDERERRAEFGEQENLHICAEHLIANADTNPVVEGHRAAVYFALAKQLTNWKHCDHNEALNLMRSVNEASPDPILDAELSRILSNAERGQFTSTGCDDVLVLPYTHPDCPIAHPKGTNEKDTRG